MPETPARYEFRAFARHFGLAEERLRRLGQPEQIRASDEIYVMAAGNEDHNTKIRDDLLDIKVLVRRERGLEQWEPRLKGRFPMAAGELRERVFPAFGVPLPSLERDLYSLDQFLDELVRPHRDLVPVQVSKLRFGYQVQGCIAERAQVWVNGAGIDTMAAEAQDPEAVLAIRRLLALDEYENVNYLLAIKRIIGMAPLPR